MPGMTSRLTSSLRPSPTRRPSAAPARTSTDALRLQDVALFCVAADGEPVDTEATRVTPSYRPVAAVVDEWPLRSGGPDRRARFTCLRKVRDRHPRAP